MNISDLHKATVLMTLYNKAIKHYNSLDGHDMNELEAQMELDNNPDEFFGNLYGRPLFVDLKDLSNVNFEAYNRNNGKGKAERLIAQLRKH